MTTNLTEGQLEFKIGKTTWQPDLITLKLTAEEQEAKHGLEQTEHNQLVPTLPFLTDLAAKYAELGAVECTPTMAKTIWIIVATKFIQLSGEIESTITAMMSE